MGLSCYFTNYPCLSPYRHYNVGLSTTASGCRWRRAEFTWYTVRAEHSIDSLAGVGIISSLDIHLVVFVFDMDCQ